ncbi:MAG: hypothetical protein KKB51_23645 [Candidatus Riflebacteria bacterium]|nr:hypothetical protein [Candidatus Riflebacteria bacterium]
MRNLLIAVFCVLVAVSAFAADVVAPAAAVVAPAVDVAAPVAAVTEFSGIIEVTPADTEAGQTEPTIVLDMGENTYKLVADAAKLAELTAFEGKALTVKGALVAATEADAIDSIKVESWVETEIAVTDEVPVETDAPDAE